MYNIIYIIWCIYCILQMISSGKWCFWFNSESSTKEHNTKLKLKYILSAIINISKNCYAVLNIYFNIITILQYIFYYNYNIYFNIITIFYICINVRVKLGLTDWATVVMAVDELQFWILIINVNKYSLITTNTKGFLTDIWFVNELFTNWLVSLTVVFYDSVFGMVNKK